MHAQQFVGNMDDTDPARRTSKPVRDTAEAGFRTPADQMIRRSDRRTTAQSNLDRADQNLDHPVRLIYAYMQ